MKKKIIIIGGGIAGLSAGIYAQLKGFSSTICEQHTVPGGECTGWDRQGFHIDGCIHWLTGSKPETALGKIWREIHALGPDVPVYQPESFITVEHEAVTVSLYRDLDRLRSHLTEISPDDRQEIDQLCEAIARMDDPGMPALPPDLMNPVDLIRMIASSKTSQKIMKQFGMSLQEYASRFRHPAIRLALLSVIPEDQTAYVLIFTLGTICSGNGGRPGGGSRAMALRMADYYRSLGGQLLLGQPVERILIRDGKAVGVELTGDPDYENETVLADYVIPATDLHVVLSTLLEGRYPAAQIDMRDMDPATYPTPTCVYAAYAVDASLADVPPDLDIAVPPFTYEDTSRDRLSIKHYGYEPGFAPEGQNILIAFLPADYHWWRERSDEREAYSAEKKRLAADVQQAIVARFPHLDGKIRSLDVATPLTYERYCSAWRGSWMSYGMTPGGKRLFLRGQIKRIKNLYMAGQWLMPPGGLPVAIITGRWAIQRICKAEKMPWRW